jgi:L-alanine-DL-glutamate epimerase-like enolase superfamily enzyme
MLGAARRTAPVYASGVGPTRVRELSERAVELGIGAVKAKVGFGEETDRATIAAIRAASPQLQIFADANQAWDLDEATDQAHWLRAEGVGWLEEPVRGDAPDALSRLHERTGMPIATGENVYGLDALQRLATTPGLAHIQPDPGKSGGLTVLSSLGARLGDHCKLSPHWYAGAVGLRAAATLATALPNSGWVELDVRPNPLRDALVTDGFPIKDGRLHAPTATGLVGDLDPDRVAEFQTQTAERRSA